jgi:glycosyltransferase involved in cell wall biosynthesis
VTEARRLKILHLISQRPDSTGSGIYVQSMLREAAARHHASFLVAGISADRPPHLDGIDPNDCAFVRFPGGEISYPIVGMSDVMPYQSTRFSDLSEQDLDEYERAFSRTLERAVSAFRPHLIHSHHLWIVTSLARRLFPHIPVAATCHSSDLRQLQKCPHLRDSVLSGCLRLDAVMALSRAQEADILRSFDVAPTRVAVVGAGYDSALFTPRPKPSPPPVGVVYAGKLSAAKGVPWLLRALSHVQSPEWRLHLVGGGSGNEKERCLGLAQRLGARVIVHGALAVVDVAAIVRRSHLLVMPSFYEGLSLAVLEGLASGCRVVATDLPGLREVLGDARVDFVSLVAPPRLRSVDQPLPEDERVFEVELAAALRRQIEAANRHPNVDLRRLQQRVAAYSWSRVFERVEAVYFDVARGVPWALNRSTRRPPPLNSGPGR